MTKLIKTTDLPSTLDALELMEVKGGEEDRTIFRCLLTAAEKNVCPQGGAVATCPQAGAVIICSGGGALKV